MSQLPAPINPWQRRGLIAWMPPAIIAAGGAIAAAAAGSAVASAAVAAGLSATLGAVLGAIVSSVISIAFALLAKILAPKPRAEDIKRELRQEQSLPVKRFIYGEYRAPGTPAPWRVKGKYLYGCLILNSRPSDGSNLEIYADKRLIELGDVGNLLDFSSAGATASNSPFAGYCRFWLGLGDQTAPPDDILSEAGDIFDPTDAWQGLTVLWCALDAGPVKSRIDRWPSPTPQFEVVMRYSKVWDPRDLDQDPDDPATWRWSANQALCTLDCHRTNPIQPYGLGDLDLGIWAEAADVADEFVPLKAGGTEPRYEVNGIVAFDASELDSILSPLFQAGASEPLTVGGRTGINAAVYREPTYTVTDFIGDSFGVETLQPGRDVANVVHTTYVNREREWESAELPPYSVPGARDEDGGVATEQRVDLNLVTSPTQAARIQKLVANRLRAQRRIMGTLPPEAVDLLAGSSTNVALDEPFDAINGVYQVEDIRPTLIPEDEDAGTVAMALPVTLREYSATWFAWDPDVDEPTIPVYVPVPTGVAGVAAPASLTVTPQNVTSGGGTISTALLEWPPIDSGANVYEVQFREGGGDYRNAADVDGQVRDSSGDVYTVISPLQAGGTYDFRVRAVAVGRTSAWRETTGVTITAPSNAIAAPTNGTATAQGTFAIDVSFRLPNDPAVRGIVFYGGDTSSTGSMTVLETVYSSPNLTIEITESGLDPEQIRYYAARTLDEFDQESAFSSVVMGQTQAS